jgi:replicative DNA helicase
MSTTDPRLPRADDAERYLITCVLGWPDRVGEIVPLVQPSEFFEPLHQKIWRTFSTQLALRGCCDPEAVAKQHDCALYLFELAQNLSTTVHAESEAERVKEAAKGRALFEVCYKAAQGILRRRPAVSVLAQLDLALSAFREGAAA